MKTIFITGASTGLGKATAKLFQAKGWNVIATMRNPESESELGKLENITLLPFDVTNLEQINKTIEAITSKQNIDVVFNNAGYGLVGALESYSDEQITKQIETNLTGVLRVVKAFIPYFKKKRSGLINLAKEKSLALYTDSEEFSKMDVESQFKDVEKEKLSLELIVF